MKWFPSDKEKIKTILSERAKTLNSKNFKVE
jgi:hypothetical protein